MTFTSMAMGAADRKSAIFLMLENFVIKARTALKANMVNSDLKPEHASTTSSVVSTRCRTLPSRNIGMPMSWTIRSVIAEAKSCMGKAILFQMMAGRGTIKIK